MRFFEGLKPVLAMVLVQAMLGGVSVFFKLAKLDGMSMPILVAYRYMFSTAFVAPLALILEKGTLAQNLIMESLVLTSATFAAAMLNLTPSFTFILAVTFRVEKMGTGTLAGKAKVLGTLVSLGGAMLLSFYKGLKIDFWSLNVHILKHQDVAKSQGMPNNQVLGLLLGIISCLLYAAWFLLQAKMIKLYPVYSSAALMCASASVQATLFALFMEKDHWSSWKLGCNIRLFASVYSGIVGSGLGVALMGWCTKIKGPLYVSSFYPVSLVFVALVGSLILDEKLHLGSILGGFLIVIGLYGFLWGKAHEE
ncbi:EamA domain [Dillenia turbinata]|uniref:WAT1-related protein n=1 Tax=Dillenia turbinata TaxID=194707 RepID=A0AAN8Z322_9MAGN